MSDPSRTAAHTNRLIHETSPYLLQHAHNPVDWYAWGAEAIDRARREDRPIFLSVGYSTCYWCHVMERQSFENPAVAAEMNSRFVNVKVDREERPDVDQLYMTAVQVLTRQGGWPMSVFLTPDLRPFYGGTYFPPDDAYGRPGFVSLLNAIDEAWKNRRGDVNQSADQIVGILRRLAEPPAPEAPVTVDWDFVKGLVERSVGDYEPQFGGFGSAPKFPRETLLELLLTYLRDPGPPPAGPRMPGDWLQPIKGPLARTLHAMAHGGIRDHLGGGFHRYSTDAKWLVPHFEIMLYDNAMLGWCYAESAGRTGDSRHAVVARGIFDFTLREMTSPEGAFYTALDAEVDAMEGGSYLWTKEEVESTLREAFHVPPGGSGEFDIQGFCRVYGLDKGPNFADPHHGSGVPDKNILYLAESDVGCQSVLLDKNFAVMRDALYAARRKRKQPLLDTKVLTSWNALMIRAMAHAGSILGDRRYVDAAVRAAEYLLTRHRTADGRLLRSSGGGTTREGGPTTVLRGNVGSAVRTDSREAAATVRTAGPTTIPAFVDDYAFLAQALLALHAAGAGDRWRREAEGLAAAMVDRFGDPEAGGYYFTDRSATDLILRQKTATDSPLPSGNAVAAMVLAELGRLDEARDVLAAFAGSLERNAEGMSSMVQAALVYLRRGGEPFRVSAAGAEAPARPPSPQQAAAGVVTIAANWAGPQELRVRLVVQAGFHVNAHDAATKADMPLIPTVLSVTGAEVESIDYPPGEERSFGFAAAPLRVYAGEVGIAIRFRTPPADPAAMRVVLTYQACDETACLPPVTKAVDVPPLGPPGR